jgi:hypothetical protein
MHGDDVVQALAENRTDQALDIRILPRPSRSREGLADAQPPCRIVEFLSVAAVAIAMHIAGTTVPRESFQQLPGRPFCREIRGYSEMNGTPTTSADSWVSAVAKVGKSAVPHPTRLRMW